LQASITLLVLAVTALLLAESRNSRIGIRVFKPLASTLFVVIALQSGALDSLFGRLILLALTLSWLGDVLLIPKNRAAFLAGLASFLFAHLVFGGAFLLKQPDTALMAIAALAMAIFAAAILRWLWPKLTRDLRLPVAAYVVAISAMMILATGAAGSSGVRWAVAAGLFVVSDVFVARERFVAPAFINRLAGLPLYYSAQLLFASQAN
jgi:uncharacterized membrane protein YhhN